MSLRFSQVEANPLCVCTHKHTYSAIQFSRTTMDDFHLSTLIRLRIFIYISADAFIPLGLERVAGDRVTPSSSLFKGMYYVVVFRCILRVGRRFPALSSLFVYVVQSMDRFVNIAFFLSLVEVLEPRKLFFFPWPSSSLFLLDSNLIPPKTLTGFSIIFFPPSSISSDTAMARHIIRPFLLSILPRLFPTFRLREELDCRSPVS